MKIILVNSSIDKTLLCGVDDGRPKELNYVMGRDPPLGLCYIAAVLRENGYEDVEIIDAQVEDDSINEIAKNIIRKNPDLVGISTLTFSFLYGAELAKIIKEKIKIPVVVGGVHVDLYPEAVMSHNFFDVGVIGEGEFTFLEIVKLIENNKNNNLPIWKGLGKIKNLVFLKDGKINETKKREPIQDLDSLPFPARDLLNFDKYYLDYLSNPFVSILSSRGCPYRCSYCSKTEWSKKWRVHSPIYVVKEMEYCIENFGAKAFQFLDDTFTLHKKRIFELCKLIKERGIETEISCLTRVDRVDKEILEALKEVGLGSISFGVESGDQRILNGMNKQTKLIEIKRAFEICHELGIKTTALFMIGHPEETLGSIENTKKMIKEIKPNWFKTNILTPYPGTSLYEELLNSGKITDYWKNMTKTLKPYETPNICKNLTRKELKKMQNDINLMPYLRMPYLLNGAFNAKPKQVYRNLIWIYQIFLNRIKNF